MMKADALDYKNLGGMMMPLAKSIQFDSVGGYVPQHYYVYQQTLETLNATLAAISTLPNLLLFAAEDQGGLYLQAGVIGQENYLLPGKSSATKLVYGRKWRVDRDTPTSEIVQTALLAVQKVREHEVRELLVWRDPANGRASTPFSCHQDIQLLTRHLSVQKMAAPVRLAAADLSALLAQLRFGARRFSLQQLQELADGRLVIDILLEAEPGDTDHFAEFAQQQISLIFRQLTVPTLMHDLMDALIQISNNHCRNTFMFGQVARFSQDVDPREIGALSVRSRPYRQHMADPEFFQSFSRLNFNVDQGRVPPLGRGKLAEINRNTILRHWPLEGHVPAGLYSAIGPAAGRGAGAQCRQALAPNMAGQCQ